MPSTPRIRGLYRSAEVSLGIGIVVLILMFSVRGEAAHKAAPGDLPVPIEDRVVVEQGSSLYSEKCSACHGGEGRGGRAPCVTCGKFARSGNTNSGIYATIAAGIPMTKMGAFGSTVSRQEILSLVTYLRWKENQRVENGEILPSDSRNQKPLEFPNSSNAY